MKRPITEYERLKRRKKAHDPKRFDEIAKIAYKIFSDQMELEKALEIDENIWNVYPVDAFDEEQKSSFEFYFCGWLQYYDEIARNNAIDHTLHFKWTEKYVTVYLYPPPGNSLHPITAPPATATSFTSDPKSPTTPPPPYP